MASFLGDYEGCASNRSEKFIRAINTFLANDYPNKELIIIGDNCPTTESILRELFVEEINSELIVFEQIPKKQKLFSGKIRTQGINLAKGEIIMYLDTDDMFGNTHIRSVVEQMQSEKLDWCYFNDFINTDGGLIPKVVELAHESIGTSSIAHYNHKDVDWSKCDGYGHDWLFIQKLMKWSENNEKIFGATYIICHIPNQIDR